MAENKLSYLNRNFDDYRQSIIDITRQYYPDVFEKKHYLYLRFLAASDFFLRFTLGFS